MVKNKDALLSITCTIIPYILHTQSPLISYLSNSSTSNSSSYTHSKTDSSVCHQPVCFLNPSVVAKYSHELQNVWIKKGICHIEVTGVEGMIICQTCIQLVLFGIIDHVRLPSYIKQSWSCGLRTLSVETRTNLQPGAATAFKFRLVWVLNV